MPATLFGVVSIHHAADDEHLPTAYYVSVMDHNAYLPIGSMAQARVMKLNDKRSAKLGLYSTILRFEAGFFGIMLTDRPGKHLVKVGDIVDVRIITYRTAEHNGVNHTAAQCEYIRLVEEIPEYEYSEGKIRSILLADQTRLFEVVSATKAYFNLSGNRKEYANMYLKFICLKAAAGILIKRLRDFGLTEDDEEQKTVVRVAYYVSLDFVKRFVNTNLIEFYPFRSYHGINESTLLLLTLSDLRRYAEDMEHLAATGEPHYEIPEDDDGLQYTRKLQYKFIQETHEVKFLETENGIVLHFHFEDLYNEYNLDGSIAKTLICIRKVLLEEN